MESQSASIERILFAAHLVLLTGAVMGDVWLVHELQDSFDRRDPSDGKVEVRPTNDGGIVVLGTDGRARKLARHGSYWAIACESEAEEPEWAPRSVARVLAEL